MSDKLVPVHPVVPKGKRIEVIVRYDGQEFTMTSGTVEQVTWDREVLPQPFHADEVIPRYEPSPIETLTIVVRR